MNLSRLSVVFVAVLLLTPSGCRWQAAPPAPANADIDRLLGLMQQRLGLMHDVARWKWNAKQPVADPERERQLLDRLAEQGKKHGLDPAFTRAFFRAQIEAAKLLQQADFDDWQARGQGPFVSVPDLGKELRPRIDALGDELLGVLARVQAARAAPGWPRALDERAGLLLSGDGIAQQIRAAALAPLKDQPGNREPKTGNGE
jgi:chorismate mutase